jgi:hypothetical protein
MRVLSIAICSVLSTFPVFCVYCVVHHLHAADVEVTWPIKCVIIYLSPLSLKIIVCLLFQAQRPQTNHLLQYPRFVGCVSCDAYSTRTLAAWRLSWRRRDLVCDEVETAVFKGRNQCHLQIKDFLIFISDIYRYTSVVGRVFLNINYTVVFRDLNPCTCVALASTFRRKMLYPSWGRPVY